MGAGDRLRSIICNIVSNRSCMPEAFLGISDIEVEFPEFELSDVADGLAALEVLFKHYNISARDQEEYFNATLTMTAALLANSGTIITENPQELPTVKVTATIPIPTEPFLENRMAAQSSILDRYEVTEEHRQTMKNGVLFYASCIIFNDGMFPKPGIPDMIHSGY